MFDVNNVYVSAFNHGYDTTPYVDLVPADRIVQMHLAERTDRGTQIILDTHNHPVADRSGRSTPGRSTNPAAPRRCSNGTPTFRHFPNSWRNSAKPKPHATASFPMRRRRLRRRPGALSNPVDFQLGTGDG